MSRAQREKHKERIEVLETTYFTHHGRVFEKCLCDAEGKRRAVPVRLVIDVSPGICATCNKRLDPKGL